MSGVSVVSGALANGDGPVVVSTDKPVFSDDSGVRATVLKWGVWAICLSAVLLGSCAGSDSAHPRPASRHGSVAAAPRPARGSGRFANAGIVTPTASAVGQVPVEPDPDQSERPEDPDPYQHERPAEPDSQAGRPEGCRNLGRPNEHPGHPSQAQRSSNDEGP